MSNLGNGQAWVATRTINTVVDFVIDHMSLLRPIGEELERQLDPDRKRARLLAQRDAEFPFGPMRCPEVRPSDDEIEALCHPLQLVLDAVLHFKHAHFCGPDGAKLSDERVARMSVGDAGSILLLTWLFADEAASDRQPSGLRAQEIPWFDEVAWERFERGDRPVDLRWRILHDDKVTSDGWPELARAALDKFRAHHRIAEPAKSVGASKVRSTSHRVLLLLLHVGAESDARLVVAKQMATCLDITIHQAQGSVRRLREKGLVETVHGHGCYLTAAGKEEAQGHLDAYKIDDEPSLLRAIKVANQESVEELSEGW